MLAWPPLRALNFGDALADECLGSVNLIQLARILSQEFGLITFRQLALAHGLERAPGIVAVMMVYVGGPRQDIFVKIGQTRRRRLIALESGYAMLEEGLARQPFQRCQPAIIAVELVSFVAFIQQETQPGRR